MSIIFVETPTLIAVTDVKARWTMTKNYILIVCACVRTQKLYYIGAKSTSSDLRRLFMIESCDCPVSIAGRLYRRGVDIRYELGWKM